MDVTLGLNEDIIEHIKMEVREPLQELLGERLVSIILFGSCARGDYKKESDIDIAIITRTSREENVKLRMELASIATEFAMKYFAVVNFLCIPENEYLERKSWYSLYKNISTEGVML
ncbi:MAG: nucleotidyltransferase domain-containing protein [Lachnospiraceae bacterium]|nr:nucleotidyltransferase domain-containing protein [Lachnospiraceae bacterium]MBQ8319027.1 nucleotidyltransferase domain-containing protein [Lachnospiraceae bacterium]